ncbi:MAG: hypothetical protein MZV64_11365 [Ignavibacteriales bacterium]|nr:hypothetical protein [Ignavibacteriales bacterium]
MNSPRPSSPASAFASSSRRAQSSTLRPLSLPSPYPSRIEREAALVKSSRGEKRTGRGRLSLARRPGS